MTTFNAITPLWSKMPLTPEESQVKEETPALSFGDIFRSALQSVNEAQAEWEETDYLLATGQLDNPAVSTIAAAKAEMSIAMLAQLRNKALDAYNELMRISL